MGREERIEGEWEKEIKEKRIKREREREKKQGETITAAGMESSH